MDDIEIISFVDADSGKTWQKKLKNSRNAQIKLFLAFASEYEGISSENITFQFPG